MDIEKVKTALIVAEKAALWPALKPIQDLVMITLTEEGEAAKEELEKIYKEAAEKKQKEDEKAAAEAKAQAEKEAKANAVPLPAQPAPSKPQGA